MSNAGTTRLRRSTLVCPVCNSDARIRDSEQVSPLVKDIWVMCNNADCGLTWKAQIAFVYVLSPSAIDHDHMDLPQPPANLARKTFPCGPPRQPPDPDQLTMFEDNADIAA